MDGANENDSPDHQLCLICSSSVIPSDIKVEPYLEDQDDNKSCLIFLLSTILEIPQNSLTDLQEKLTNQELINSYCEPCTKLIYSANQIYTQILELTRKFRKIQTQIVSLVHLGGTTLSTSNHDGLFHLCRNDLNKNDFNGFGYPFVVDDRILLKNCAPFTPKSTECQEEDDPLNVKVKEEAISENEDDNDDDDGALGENDEDYQAEDDNTQDSTSTSADEASQTESDSDFEPSPPPKKVAKKAVIKKPPSSSPSPPKKVNRKSPSPSKPPRPRKKPPPKKLSRFDRLYPNYPKRIRNPTTKLFHCSEPSCSKTYNRKTRIETHIMIEHLQDNYFKCKEPFCGKSYCNPENYQDHVSWHAGIPRWKCQEKVTTTLPDGSTGTVQCSEQFFGRRKLVRHVQKVHNNNPFVCELCGEAFDCQDYLTCHKSAKHTEKGKERTSKYKYVAPVATHICNYCGKIFKVRSNMETHINLVHEQTNGKYECTFCEKRFFMKTKLRQHCWNEHQFSLEGYQPPKRKTKVRVWAYQCEVKGCKKGYLKEESFRKHMEEIHKGGGVTAEGTPHYHLRCKYCGKGFHIKNKLEAHQEAHENKESKPYSCEVCGNRFAVLHYLKMHRWNAHKIPMENARKNKGINKV